MTPANTTTELAIETLKESFMAGLAQATHDMLPELLEDLRGSEDLELKRKFLTQATDILGWKKAPPKDANEGLPVFNFNFGTGGQMQVTSTAPDGTETILEFQPDRPVPAIMQSAAIEVNDDIFFPED